MISFNNKKILCVLGNKGIIEYFEIKFESKSDLKIGKYYY